MNAIEIYNISKSYGKTQALKGISLQVAKGEIFGLIGPDGAGKSTLFRILATLLVPDSGHAAIDGMDVVEDYMTIRKHIGYMPGRFSLYQDLSVRENLEFFATLFGTTVEDNYSTIQDVYSKLEPFENRRAGKLSGGMKQKLALCCALVHRPSALLLDEPTTGVDAVSRSEFWNMLKRISSTGVTIFVSTPYMDEAAMCDRIALMREGIVIDSGTPQEITSKFPHELYSVKGRPMHALLKYLRSMEDVLSCFSFGDCHHATLPAGKEISAAQIASAGFSDVQIKRISPGIEDCFMELSQRNDYEKRH